MAQFTFTDRATWMAFRADWRARYKAQSEEIRIIKREMASRKGQDNSSLQSNLHYLRQRANQMMVELNEAKEFKAAQFAARELTAA